MLNISVKMWGATLVIKDEPFFRTDRGALFLGDALELLKEIDSKSIDLVITDPPYGVIGIQDGYKIEWDSFRSDSEFYDFTLKWLNQIYRVLKVGGQAYIFWSQKRMFRFRELVDNTKFRFKRMLIWYHSNLAKPTRKMYLWTYDPIFYLIKGDKPKYFDADFVSRHNVDVFIIPKPQNWKNKIRYHPCEKPIELIKILIMNSSKPGDTVLDCFAGSGTTLVASEELGRRWIGIEINKEYCEIAKHRLEKLRGNIPNTLNNYFA